MILFPLALAAAAQPSADLQQVQHYLQALQSLQAGFSQTDRNGRVLTGTLWLKRPGKIRFQYAHGVPLLIVADGGSLTFIDYSVRQVQRWPIRNSPLGVLLDPTRDISGFAKAVPGIDPRVLSVEVNDTRHPEYGRITLVFARDAAGPAGLTLQGWVADDAQNNRTTVRLTNQRYGVAIADSTFTWRDPRQSGGRH